MDLHDNNLDDISDQSDIHSDYQVVDADGNLSQNVKSEWGGFLELSQSNIICASDCEFSDHNPYMVSQNTYKRNSGSENIVGTNHSHPNAGERFIRGDGSIRTWGMTVKGDMSRAANRSGYFNAAVDSKNITLYNEKVSIQVSRKFFNR